MSLQILSLLSIFHWEQLIQKQGLTHQSISLKVVYLKGLPDLFPNHLHLDLGEDKKQQIDASPSPSSSSKRKRASLSIPLEAIIPHHGKTLNQAALDIKISESKLKNAIKQYGYSNWTNFKYKIRHDLSRNSIHSSIATNSHGGDISNTSGLQVLCESDQHTMNMQVLLEAANVDQSSVNDEVFFSQPNENSTHKQKKACRVTQFTSQPQNKYFTTSPHQTISLSHGGATNRNYSELAGNMNCFAAPYSETDATLFSLQQNQSYSGTSCVTLSCSGAFINTDGLPLSYPSNHHHLSMLYQGENMNYNSSHASYSVNTSTSILQPYEIEQIKEYADQTQCVSLFCGGDVSNQVFNESNKHNMPMPPQTKYLDQFSTLPSLSRDSMLVQEYFQTDYPIDLQYLDQFDMMSWPTRTQKDEIIRDVEPAGQLVPVKATYGRTTARFELFTSSKMEDLKREVIKILYLEEGNYELKYLNILDDWIPIVCDADLKICLDAFNSSNRTAVVMLVFSIA